jgi:hypothetical protein
MPETMLLTPLSIDPPPTVVVVALDVIVEAAPDPVALETLPLAFVSAPV